MYEGFQPYQMRVVEERKALLEKLAKLHAFLATTEAEDLPRDELALLYKQAHAMLEYSRILGARIALWL